MNRALRTAATGMYAQQLNVDTIAHNLANVNTTGFKKSRPEFQDLMYQNLKTTGVSQNPNVQVPSELQVGTGAIPVSTNRSFSQGEVTPTQNSLDVAIQGEGFLQIRRPDGTLAYTRDGAFKISGEGSLVNAAGYLVEPALTFADDSATISIATDGTIEATAAGSSESVKLGQFELVKFINPAGLRSIGGNLFVETVASGPPIVGMAGSEGFGEIKQNALESSNVDVVEEMVSMITAQRAYEINAKTIKTVEDMLSIANNIKRG
jgi:flagellar basal-body rod protein FlgG